LQSSEYRQRNAELIRRPLAGDEPRMEVEIESSNVELKKLFSYLRRAWNRLGETDPFWSILVSDRYRGRPCFGPILDEFFKTGRQTVETLKATLTRNGHNYEAFNEVLDFGCGVGRVTHWLARDISEVFGYDVSQSHLRVAEKHAPPDAQRKITWRLIRSLTELDHLPKVDLVHSVIVLQHNPPPLMAAMIRCMLKALRPGGVAVFQLATYKLGYRFTIKDYLNGGAKDGMEMHFLPQSCVFGIIRSEKCRLLEVLEDGWIGNREKELSNTFVVERVS
jgi:SAM-dependent methyltransferase